MLEAETFELEFFKINEFSAVFATEAFIDHFNSDVVFLFNHLGAQATYKEEMGSTELGWNFACVLVCLCVCVCAD